MPETPVLVPRENVNDDSIRLIAWLVGDGQAVSEGQPIAEIETSKARADIAAPVAGTLTRSCREGDEVAVGAILGYIGNGAPADVDQNSALTPPVAASITTPPPPGPITPDVSAAAHPQAGPARAFAQPQGVPPLPPAGLRLSAKASEFIKRAGIDPATLPQNGMLRERDLIERLTGNPPANAEHAKADPAMRHAPPSPLPPNGVAVRTEALPRTKRTEAKYLAAGLHGALPSVVSVACPTRGLKAATHAHALIGEQPSAIIIAEAARLLRKYPVFNAYHTDGHVNYYENVNIGYAIDAGRGLKVPIIRDADTKSIPQIVPELQEMLVLYLEDKLPVESLSGGTFTITDLSGDGVFYFHPLINQGQCAILGIGAEFFAPGSAEGMFNLILGFDHQLSEGREAARFLNDLKQRIEGYERALADGAASAVETECCSRCLKPIVEVERDGYQMLQMRTSGRKLKLICSRCVLGQW